MRSNVDTRAACVTAVLRELPLFKMETEAGVGHGLLADVLHRYAPFMLDTVVAVLSLLTVFTLGPALFVEHAQRQDWEDHNEYRNPGGCGASGQA